MAGALVIGVVAAVVLRPRPVHVPLPSPTGAAARACADLAGRLPDHVDGQGRRPTTPGSADTAAWGATPILLRCGVERPAALQPTSEVTTVDGVDWFAQRLQHGLRLTTTGRTAYVEVTVPDTYAPASDVLADLSPAVRATVPTTS